MDKKKKQKIVRRAYARIAKGQEGCGCGPCGPDESLESYVVIIYIEGHK